MSIIEHKDSFEHRIQEALTWPGQPLLSVRAVVSAEMSVNGTSKAEVTDRLSGLADDTAFPEHAVLDEILALLDGWGPPHLVF